MNKINKLFVDCDGVVAHFDARAREIFGMEPEKFEDHHGSKIFWKSIRDYRNEHGYGFFRSLDLMPDAVQLWNGVKHLEPTILTGCPFGNWSQPDKVGWAKHHFGDDVKIITCMAKEKFRYIENEGDILIDDKTKYQHIWEENGGVFVHHTSAENSLSVLRDMGII